MSATLGDATVPSGVPGLSLRASGGQVTASWAAAQDHRAIRGYRVSRNGVVTRDVAALQYSERPPTGKHTYSVVAIDTSGNLGPASAVVTPSATTGSSIAKPRIVLLGRKHKGRNVTMRFVAKGATGMRAYRRGKRIARTRSERLSVTTLVPRGRRTRVRIVASSRAGDSVKHFTIR